MKLRQWLIELPISLIAGIYRSGAPARNGTKNPDKARIGSEGEAIARRYLKKKGWRLIAKNVRLGHDELDILAVTKDEKVLVIIEVRSTANPLKKPELTVSIKKRTKMLRVARKLYPLAMRHACELRVDVIAVQLAHEYPLITHYEGVFPLQNVRYLL